LFEFVFREKKKEQVTTRNRIRENHTINEKTQTDFDQVTELFFLTVQ